MIDPMIDPMVDPMIDIILIDFVIILRDLFK